MTIFDAAPYRNLILTGPMGVGKTSIGKVVAARLKADFYDLETEILSREGQSTDEIRELFGEARLKALETTLIGDLALRRQAVLVITGSAMLNEINFRRLADTGPVLCLTCAVNETLRRYHIARGAWFHNPTNRATLLSRLKREQGIRSMDLPQLDTTHLSVDEAAQSAIDFWMSHADV